MSVEARQALIANPNLFYGTGTEATAQQMKTDLLTEYANGGTQSTLIGHLQWMLDQGHIIELTIVRSAHHDDGPDGHNPGGRAYDYWPLASATQDDWLDADDQRFQQCLYDQGRSEYAFQTGLNGDGSDSVDNFHYAAKGYIERGVYVEGVSTFQDSGGAHLHAGVVAE